MRLCLPENISAIDKKANEEYGMSVAKLMENAASAICDAVLEMYDGNRKREAIVFCGKGNNGGDGYAAARLLAAQHVNVRVFSLCGRNLNGEALINREICEKTGISVTDISQDDFQDIKDIGNLRNTVIIDAIFGTGFTGQVSGIYRDMINIINKSGLPVLSVDIPSGLDGLTGRPGGICIKADVTVCLMFAKTGLFLYPGYEYAGMIKVKSIGIKPELFYGLLPEIILTDREYVAGYIKKRNPETNKGDYGRVLIITGSPGMTGAGCLSAKAALRSGSGLVYLAVPESLAYLYEIKVTESITIPLKDNGTGSFFDGNETELQNILEGKDVCLIGPGMSQRDETVKFVQNMLPKIKIPLIIDADALNAVSRDVSIFGRLQKMCVITPHPGEMSRLTGLSINEIQNDRLNIARDYAHKWNTVVLLKGNRTIIAAPDSRIAINPTGNPGMATAGSGDVLAGMIASFRAGGLGAFEAAVCGAYLHGEAGNVAAEKYGEASLLAGDIADCLM